MNKFKLTPFLAKELNDARVVTSFCGHDLRGELGRSLSFLQLIEQGIVPAEDLNETLAIIKKSVENGLASLDGHLEKHASETRHMWIFSDRPELQVVDGLLLFERVLCRIVSPSTDIKTLRKDFRPDFVVIDVTENDPGSSERIVEGIGLGLTEFLMLTSALSPLLEEIVRESHSFKVQLRDSGTNIDQWIQNISDWAYERIR